jgi:hypothetical protein
MNENIINTITKEKILKIENQIKTEKKKEIPELVDESDFIDILKSIVKVPRVSKRKPFTFKGVKNKSQFEIWKENNAPDNLKSVLNNKLKIMKEIINKQ